jgi:hypothetical protein
MSAPIPAVSGAPAAPAPKTSSNPAPASQNSPKPASGSSSPKPANAPATSAPKVPDASGEWSKPKRYEFKIDGKPVVKEFKSEAELTTFLQKGLASEKRFNDASEKEKRIQALIARGAQGDVFEAAKEIWGVDLEAHMEERLAKKWNKATMSEEERAQLELKEENERYKKQLAEIEEGKKRDAKKAFEEKTWKEFEGNLHKALETSGLEKSRETLWLIGDVNDAALAAGIELSPQQMVAEAEHRAASYARGTILKKKGAALLEALGPDVIKEVLRAEVERRRGVSTSPEPGQVASPAPKPGTGNAEPPGDTAIQRKAQRRAPEPKEKSVSPSRFRTMRRFGLVD